MKTPDTPLFRARPFLQRASIFALTALSTVFLHAEGSIGVNSAQEIAPIPEPLGISNPKSSVGHYQDDIPPVAPGAYSPSPDFVPSMSKNTWFTISASGLYIFDTHDDIKGHTGWGGVLDASAMIIGQESGFYLKAGLDFVYFQTDAEKGRGGIVYDEEIQSYKLHVNGGVGYRIYGFDLYGWLGVGFGATHTNGTTYNDDGSHTSADFLFQAGARISYSPTEYCSIFAGYRMMWNVPLQTGRDCYYDDYDDDDWWGGRGGYRCHDRCILGCPHDSGCNCPGDKRDYPSVLAHAFEVGITFYF